MKGQAFIVFRDINSATSARHALDNALVFGKNLKVNFAKSTSDTIAKLSGQFSQKDKAKRDQERRKRREEEYQMIIKKQKEIGVGGSTKEKKEVKEVTQTKQQLLTPNNILFIENLTSDITEPILRVVFSKYNGFKEVRLYPGRGIAFVEYDTEINAGAALLGLNNYALTNECILHISFAKK